MSLTDNEKDLLITGVMTTIDRLCNSPTQQDLWIIFAHLEKHCDITMKTRSNAQEGR